MAMDPALITALTVAIPAVIASTVAPAIIVWMNGRNASKQRAEEARLRKEEKDYEYARQDAVAKRLVESNKVIANEVVKSASVVNEKLDEVHVLVNSAYTAALQSAFEAVQAKYVVLQDSMEFKQEHDIPITSDVKADLEATKTKMDELSAAIAERLRKDAETKEAKAKAVLAGAQLKVHRALGADPLPVADERTAVASERVADAAERSADATTRVADAAEEKNK